MGSAPTSLALQLQGAAIGLLLLGGWLWAGIMRNRELRRQRRSRHYRLSNVHSGTAQRLGVSAQVLAAAEPDSNCSRPLGCSLSPD